MFPERLKQLRESKGLSQEEMGKYLGITTVGVEPKSILPCYINVFDALIIFTCKNRAK